jgi:hypothetical protein
MTVHVFNCGDKGGEDGKIKVQGHPEQEKLAQPYLRNTLSMVVHNLIPATQEEGTEDSVLGKTRSYLKSGLKAKRAKGVTRVVA